MEKQMSGVTIAEKISRVRKKLNLRRPHGKNITTPKPMAKLPIIVIQASPIPSALREIISPQRLNAPEITSLKSTNPPWNI
jgi:hypothetical protein